MEVEVVFPQVCGAFYKAFLLDIDLTNKKAKVGFPTNWRAVAWADLGQIRYPVCGDEERSLVPGCKVEALLPHHDNEFPGWWTGVLVKSKGELNVVEFQSGSEKYQDIVEQEKLRLPNESPPLSKMKLLTKNFKVPEDIQDYCQRTAVHENFRAKIKAVCVMFRESEQVLSVVADSEDCLEKANILIDMHLKDLNTQKSLLARNEVAAHRMSNSLIMRERQAEQRGAVEVRFFVAQELVGLAIGREGVNVNEARRFDGIISIEFDDPSSMFRVKGESKEAVMKARERLEYTRDTMLIPRSLAGKMIGKKGNVITDILEKTRVNNVKVVGDEDAEKRGVDTTSFVAFDFIGRVKCIENAKLMVDYHIDHLKDVESILQTHREMGYDDDTPTYFPRPNEERRRGGQSSRGRKRYSSRGGYRNSESEQHSEQVREEEVEDQDSESDSGASVEVEESDENRKSASEEDDQPPPDRRRQQAPRSGGRGRGKGRGGYRHSRQGRGGGRGGRRGAQEVAKEEHDEEESSKPPKQDGGESDGSKQQVATQEENCEEVTTPSDPPPTNNEPARES